MRKKESKTINKLLTAGLIIGGGLVLYKLYTAADQVERAAAKVNEGGLKSFL